MNFADKKTAKELSTRALQTEEIILLLTYLGRQTTKVKIEEMLEGIDIQWVAAAFLYIRDGAKWQFYKCRSGKPRIGKVKHRKW